MNKNESLEHGDFRECNGGIDLRITDAFAKAVMTTERKSFRS